MNYFTTSDHVKLAYDIEGEGDVLLLIHGWSGNKETFKFLIDELKNDYKVISYDLRGHGQSDVPSYGLTMKRYAEDLKEFMDFLKLEKPRIIAWSMGSHILLEYISIYGEENIRSAAILDMTPKLVNDKDWKLGLYHGEYNFYDSMNSITVINSSWMKYAKSFISAAMPYFSEEQLKPVFHEAALNSPFVMSAMWHAMSQADYRPILKDINIPITIIYGENSTLYKKETAQYFKDNIKNSDVITIPQATHFLVIEQPKKVAEAIRTMA